MYLTNEKGRSMIEMLGVLAIIGVLTVGSLSIIGKARQQYTITQILSETTTLISNARKMACDYDEAYKSYTNMLYRSDAYPEGVTFKKEGDRTAFVLSSDAELEINAGSEGNSTFSATLSNIPASACVAVLTSDWNTNGLISAATNQSGDAKAKVVDLDLAATTCAASGAQLILTFTGCTRADQD